MDTRTNNFWSKKSLIWDFAISDLKARYRNSVLGFIWNFLEPLLLLTVLYFVFTNIFENTIEYFPLYLLLGLIMWNMFTRGTQLGLNSIQVRGSVLSQINIPIIIPPISTVLTSLIMLVFEMIVFVFFLIVFQFIPPSTIVIFPILIIAECVIILGIALPLSVLSIKFKDIQFIWGIVLHAGFFLHPIFYKIEILPTQIQEIIMYLPTVQILIMGRDAVLYDTLPTVENILITLISTAMIFLAGYVIFRKLSVKIIEDI